MALVLQPARVTMTVRDRNRKSSSGFFIGLNAGNPMPIDDPAAQLFLSEFYSSFRNSSDAAGVGYSITYTWLESPLLTDWVGQPNVNEKGVLSFQAGMTPSMFTIPSIKDAALDNTGRKIARNGSTFIAGTTGNIATHLQSIHDKLQNGATVDLLAYPVVDEEGNDYDGLLDAYLQTRSSSG